ncbi:MAG: DUF3782 domain-containing protein [Thermoprotei archaeon]|nr:DUF3782 domain-containing protein [Thermoprotei archaeon]
MSDELPLFQVRGSALDAIYGLGSEEVFEAEARKVVEKKFGFKLEKWREWDGEGYVFNIPRYIEVYAAASEGKVVLMEIEPKATIGVVYVFKKKAEFYEKKTGVKPSRLIVASPFIDDDARELASALEIEIYDFYS